MNFSRLLLPVLMGFALAACADGSSDPPGSGDTGIREDGGPDPDMTRPDAAEPDAAEPEPDAAEPEPDAAEPEPDAAEPEPDAGEPEPDAGEPEPDAGCVPGEELCNGLDDDCDDAIDEDFDLGGPCAAGLGACAADGVIVCAADGAGAVCDAEPGAPGDEVCNGADDDCDGEIDDGLGGAPCETGQPGACAAGVLACTDGEAACAPAVEPSAELCDGIDNDCNGAVDDVPGAGEACAAGQGACAAAGVIACGPQGLACDAVPGQPQPEVCDGIDNDCDGVPDDVDGLGRPCSVGIGACTAAGVTACGPDGEVCDAVPLAPQVEICDGLDNDCNGETDELPDCRREICDNGVDDNDDGLIDCDDPLCGAFPACRPPELCDNGADDDGDGAVDCDDPDCAPDPACAPPPLEICDNGLDDDGDGVIDCADADCANLPICQPQDEICANGADDDGDGLVDCDDPDCAFDGACADQEICDNGADDDADGFIDCLDPDCAPDPSCAPPPPELCANLLDDDGDGQTDCDDPDCQFDPACVIPPELCDNGVDDDGDGQTDCDDVDCRFFEGCVPVEICDSGADEDGDGQIDCADADCAGFPGCVPDDATPIAQPGGAIALQGQLDGASPEFDRPGEVCDAGDPGRRYRAYRIVNRTGAGQVVHIEADWGAGDGFLLIYAAPFDPAAPLDGCIVGNDDDAALIRSAVRDLPIAAGEELVVVASTFDPGVDLGPFTITVTTEAVPVDELCGNGLDDDLDGFVDCADPDCADDALCGPTPIAPVGDSIALLGQLDGASPVFDREANGCAPSASPGRPFQTFPIVNRTGADQLITVTARWNVGDGYLFVYRAPFDPANPAVGCLDGDDDFTGLGDSQVAELAIAADEVLVIVASAFDAGAAIGPFDLSVQTLDGGPALEICDNLRDDDGDGLADCDDNDCADLPACQVPREQCQNGVDDDGDGAVDCDDLDCADVVQCQVEICDNGEDDDGDGALDCGDADCAGFPGCEVCPVIHFDDGLIPADFGSTGQAPWTVEDGAATSGLIFDDDTSGLTLPVSTPGGGRVQFDYRISSEAIFDFLRFFVDGVEVDTWDGEEGFLTVGYDLAPGDHVLEWRYTKDGSQLAGEDLAQIDNILLIGAATCPGSPVEPGDAVPIADPGGTLAFVGELDAGSPVFARPEEDCLGANPDRRYQTVDLVNLTGADQLLTVTGVWNAGDGFLLVYRGFDPLDGAAGCLAGNDDIAAGDTTGSQIVDLPIAPGEVLTLVATSFAAGADLGPFDIEVLTQGEVIGGDGTCAAPFEIVPDTYEGSSADAPSNLWGACGGDGSPEVVHLLAGDGGTYCIGTGGSAFDTVLYVFADICGDPAAEVVCNDDGGGLPNFASQVELVTEVGAGYLIVVDGYSGFGDVNFGDYVLDIAPGACL